VHSLGNLLEHLNAVFPTHRPLLHQ
jgi:hypothetical protein